MATLAAPLSVAGSRTSGTPVRTQNGKNYIKIFELRLTNICSRTFWLLNDMPHGYIAIFLYKFNYYCSTLNQSRKILNASYVSLIFHQ